MSVLISYRPTEGKRYLKHSLESIATTLRRTFGDFPITLSMDDYKILLAMAEVWGGETETNPYFQLAEAMENHGELIVNAEY